MIHPLTAGEIGREVSIIGADHVLTGEDLEGIPREKWEERLRGVNIFSRVNPRQKLELVDFYQSIDRVVGMTGDGVNDAPALRKADIGIAMGVRGTQVAKEAADMVLQNDSFESIAAAIRYGRIIFSEYSILHPLPALV